MRNKKLQMLIEGGLMCGLSLVLGLIKLFEMPQGGSITAAQFLPIFIFALRWGVGPGTLCGLAAGLLNWLLGGYVISPVQMLLDYPIAFTVLGLCGVAKDSKAWVQLLATLGCVVAKYICHVLTGAIFFGEYAGLQNVWIYSFGYNAYIFVDYVVDALLLIPVMIAVKKIKK